MTSKTIQPEGWKAAKGYANAILSQGRFLFLGGQIGWNAQQEFESDDFIEQFKQTLKNIKTLIEEAGGQIEHITRLTWFITDKAAYVENLKEIGDSYRDVMGYHFPTMSVIVVSALIEDRAKIEIEATAILPD